MSGGEQKFERPEANSASLESAVSKMLGGDIRELFGSPASVAVYHCFSPKQVVLMIRWQGFGEYLSLQSCHVRELAAYWVTKCKPHAHWLEQSETAARAKQSAHHMIRRRVFQRLFAHAVRVWFCKDNGVHQGVFCLERTRLLPGNCQTVFESLMLIANSI